MSRDNLATKSTTNQANATSTGVRVEAVAPHPRPWDLIRHGNTQHLLGADGILTSFSHLSLTPALYCNVILSIIVLFSF